MDKEQLLRGEIRELLSNTLTLIGALERLECDEELISKEQGRAAAYRSVLDLLNKGE
jgi:hypothetical protein